MTKWDILILAGAAVGAVLLINGLAQGSEWTISGELGGGSIGSIAASAVTSGIDTATNWVPDIGDDWNSVVQWLENINPALAAAHPAPESETGSWADAQ